MFKIADEIKIHIGAHKTATTHFQDTLEALFNHSATSQVYWSRDLCRSQLARMYDWNLRSLTAMRRKLYIYKVMKRQLATPECLLISEENLLGLPTDLIDSIPYQNPHRLLINSLSKRHKVTLYLSIRNFMPVFSGAYITALRFDPVKTYAKKSAFVKSFTEEKVPSWVELVERVQKIYPNVALRIWTQEFYKNNSQKVINEFCGNTFEDIPSIPPPESTLTPSFRAVEEVERLIASNAVVESEWRSRCEAIYREYPADEHSKFRIVDSRYESVFKERYDNDLAEINARWPEMLIGAAD